MKQRQLENNLDVSEIGLGCMNMNHAYGKLVPKGGMVKLLRHAVNLGGAQGYSVWGGSTGVRMAI